jgi:glutaredoxin
MFTTVEEKQILALKRRLSRDITISVVAAEHNSSRLLQEFCDTLADWVPQIKIKKEDGRPQQLPQITIGNGLHYQAVPSGHELPPFLEALEAFDSDSLKIPENVKKRLQKNHLPATLTVFIAPQCTFCPQAVRQLFPLPMADDKLQLIVIDGTLFPEAARNYKIQSVPTILLDDQFRWTGSLPLEEIIDTIHTRDPMSLGASSIENIIKDGQAEHLAGTMLASNKIFAAFYELLTHEEWPVRLGAMVVMEEIAARNPAVASEAINPLWEHFDKATNQIKGDILYMFGEIGDRGAISKLETVLADEFDEEVKEAAREALEKLR